MKIVKIINFILVIYVFLYSTSFLHSQRYEEEMLLDGLDSLVSFNIDTTGHWWAATMPYKDRYRIYIDDFQSDVYEDIMDLKISSDGIQWAFWGIKSGSAYLIRKDEFENMDIFPVEATDVGDITYSLDGTQFAYSYFHNDNEIINLPFREISVINRSSKLFIDNSGKQFAFVGARGNKYVININGKESTVYDEIKPIGFWHKGTFIYAGFNGSNWEIINGNKTIGTSYWRILETQINKYGTVMAVLVQLISGRCMSITFSDDYYEPIYGKTYDATKGLALHPTDVLIGYGASEHNKYYILQNGTEYYCSTPEIGSPYYSHNGEELIFIGMGEYGPYINVNGHKTDIRIGLDGNDKVAKKPKSTTISYSTNISLYLYDYEKNTLKSGNMYDYLCQPIYNRRNNSYEALATIYNRLYLCRWKM
jgi:hypothetical protein